jgi:hypothetical protein
VTDDGCEVLSVAAPKTVAEIETVMETRHDPSSLSDLENGESVECRSCLKNKHIHLVFDDYCGFSP